MKSRLFYLVKGQQRHRVYVLTRGQKLQSKSALSSFRTEYRLLAETQAMITQRGGSLVPRAKSHPEKCRRNTLDRFIGPSVRWGGGISNIENRKNDRTKRKDRLPADLQKKKKKKKKKQKKRKVKKKQPKTNYAQTKIKENLLLGS